MKKIIGILVLIILMFIIFIISDLFNNNEFRKKDENKTKLKVNYDPEMQNKRFQFIEELKEKNIIYKIEKLAKYPHVYVYPIFEELSIDVKKQFISVIYAYYISQNPECNNVLLFESRNGKQIGYFDNYGLHIK